ncbi:MAG: helix-turn-helix domain-containing protein [Aeromicrobium sp.]
MTVQRTSASTSTTRYDDLLDRAVDHVIESGMPSLSVRRLADALGVAHNTITYHFGTRSQLLEAIFGRLAEHIRRDTSADELGEYDNIEQAARARITATWDWLTDPAHRPVWTTFFEVFALAIREPATYRGFLDHVANDWVHPLAEEMLAVGMDRPLADARATLLVATVRGLVIELQAAADPDLPRIHNALEALLDVVSVWADQIDRSSD